MNAGPVRVDVVILTLAGATDHGGSRSLRMVVTRLADVEGFALPGDLLRASEDLEEAAGRVLAGTGLRTPRHLEQLASFGRPDRMPGARTISVTYLALVPEPFEVGGDARWTGVGGPALAWDHDLIVEAAVQRVRSKLSYSNIAYGLLPDEFTMTELQEVYEAVLSTAVDKRNFRKKVLALDLLVDTGGQRRGSHRPAALYRFTSESLVLLDEVIVSG